MPQIHQRFTLSDPFPIGNHDIIYGMPLTQIVKNIMVDVATYRPEIVHDMFHHKWQ